MKINHRKLQEEMANLLAEKLPSSRKNCPSPGTLVNFYRGKLNKKSAAKVAEHLCSCLYCAGEGEAIREIIKSENQLIREFRQIKKESIGKFSFLNWKLTAGLIGAAALFILFFLITNPSTNRYYRSNRDSPFSVQSPQYQAAPQPALTFQWEKVENARAYSLELFGPALSPIWQSPRVETTSLTLPEEILAKLEKNKTYFWILTAYPDEGDKIESPLYHFTYTQK